MGIRNPDLSGSWYPSSKGECVKIIENYKASILIPDVDYYGFGGIVPHAGWYFSGKTAFSVFYSIYKKIKPDTFFLFGMHLPVNGPNYIFIDDGINTPFGVLKVNDEAAKMLCNTFDFIKEDAKSYTQDNTVELQLPFIKYLFPEVNIVTLGVSPTNTAINIGEKACDISKELGLKACFIGSTDLTHYGPNYGFIPKGVGAKSIKWAKEVNDKRIVDLFIEADPFEVMKEASASHNACCPGAASAAIAALKKMKIQRGVLVKYDSSYDIHPDSSFVGYSGIVY